MTYSSSTKYKVVSESGIINTRLRTAESLQETVWVEDFGILIVLRIVINAPCRHQRQSNSP